MTSRSRGAVTWTVLITLAAVGAPRGVAASDAGQVLVGAEPSASPASPEEESAPVRGAPSDAGPRAAAPNAGSAEGPSGAGSAPVSSVLALASERVNLDRQV